MATRACRVRELNWKAQNSHTIGIENNNGPGTRFDRSSRNDASPMTTSSRSSVEDAGDLVAELLSISAGGRVGYRGCRSDFNLSDHGLSVMALVADHL